VKDVPLKEHFERILDEHDRAHNAEHIAVGLAAKDLERRLDGLNELRAEVVQDRSQYMLVSTYDVKHQALIDRLDRIAVTVEERRELLEKAVDIHFDANEERIVDIEKFRSKATLVATGLVVLGGVLGATIVRVLGG
jgi:replicative DNA helicase